MADTEFKYDVFVSYNSANKYWVRKSFIPILEKAGLKVCDYYRDFDAGAPIVLEIERAILQSHKTIPILSPAYLKSGWTEFEDLMLQTLDADNRERRMLPVILESCELPPRIRYMNCINFSNPDDIQIEWERLSRALGVTLSPTPRTPDTGSRDTWHLAHPYPMPPNFTGRVDERIILTNWLTEDSENRLFILCALGGFGKSALAWHWLTQDVDPKVWSKVLWWSFYEGDASFEHFVEETLKYLKRDVPQGRRAQVDELLKTMQEQKILLIMDGFERALRVYSSMSAAYQGDEFPLPQGEGKGESALDCVDVNAETFLKGVCSLPQMQGKVSMTTRLTPRAVQPRGECLQGCREVELTAMDKTDAVAFFHVQGIQGTRAEIEAACEPYGYHPLSLRLLSGRILKDFENPADIVVAQKLKIDGDLKAHQHHVLEVSYNSLPALEQKLLSTISCFRSAVELKTIEAITVGATHASPQQNELRDLVDRGLLHFDDKNKKFDLHPIVRRYAYDRLTAPEKAGAHQRLVNYFEAVPKPEKVEKPEDLAPVIELYHHMVRAGNLDEACDLLYERLVPNPLHFQFGAYQLMIELERALFPDGEDKPPRLKKEADQAWTLSILSSSYFMNGQPVQSVQIGKAAVELAERVNDKKNTAIGLGNIGQRQISIGALSAAERNMRRSIDLCREIVDEFNEASGHKELIQVLTYIGSWELAEAEFERAVNIPKNITHAQHECVAWAYRAQRFLLMAHANPQSKIVNLKLAIESAKRALGLADEWQKITGHSNPNPRDYTRGLWLLGAAYRANNELILAEENLSKALNLCRQINMVDHEAKILLDLARLRYAQGDLKDAQEKASEALTITERSGYVLQGADVHLFLAELASLAGSRDLGSGIRGGMELALRHAKEALRLAHCDDGPPYYYKVAYEEAERLIEKLQK